MSYNLDLGGQGQPYLKPGAIVPRQSAARDYHQFAPEDFGAIGNGSSHPLSSVTTISTSAGAVNTAGWTLLQWQTIYPHATALTNELDWCAIQAAVNTGPFVVVQLRSGGVYQIDQSVTIAQSATTIDGSFRQGTINSTSANADHITVTGAVTEATSIRIVNTVATRSVLASAGYFVNFLSTSLPFLCEVSGNYIFGGNKQFGGVSFSGVESSVVTDNFFGDMLGAPIQIGGTAIRASDSNFIERNKFSNVNHSVSTLAEALVTGAIVVNDYSSALYVRDNEMFSGSNGWLVYFGTTTPNASANQQFWFSGNQSDGSGAVASGGFYIDNCVNAHICNGNWVIAQAGSGTGASAMSAVTINSANAFNVNVNDNLEFALAMGPNAAANCVNLNGSNIQFCNNKVISWSGTNGNGTGINLGSAATCVSIDSVDFYTVSGVTFGSCLRFFGVSSNSHSIDNIRCRAGVVAAGSEIVGLNFDIYKVGEVLSPDAYPAFSVAAASTLNLPSGVEQVYITGTGTVNTITPRFFGQRLRLVLAAATVTLANSTAGTTGTLRLTGNANITPPYGYWAVNLWCNGTTWYQV